jgi:hypothetical protein
MRYIRHIQCIVHVCHIQHILHILHIQDICSTHSDKWLVKASSSQTKIRIKASLHVQTMIVQKSSCWSPCSHQLQLWYNTNMFNMLKHMVLKGFEISDNDELPDEQDGCMPVHHCVLHTGIMHKHAKICKICKICQQICHKTCREICNKKVEYATTLRICIICG